MERERESSVVDSIMIVCFSKLPSKLHWVSSYYHLVQALSDAGTLDILIQSCPMPTVFRKKGV
jgi:hypothetical protein